MKQILPIVLCGGFGMRLWPISRSNSPKQFLNLFDASYTSFQNTLNLATKIHNKPLIIGNFTQRALIKEQLEANDANIILEPCSKNTFASCVVSCLFTIEQKYEYVIILPSDHHISQENFLKILTKHGNIINKDIIAFGVKPHIANTEYGYMKIDTHISDSLYNVEKFIEKPNEAIANKLIQDEKVYINSGIFLLHAETFLQYAQEHMQQDFTNIKDSHEKMSNILDHNVLNFEYFAKISDISIDYAILEKIQQIKMIDISDCDWHDLGSYNELYNIAQKDQNSNAISNPQNINTFDVRNSMIINQHRDMTVVTSQLDDILISLTNDILFVSKLQNMSFDLKNYVKCDDLNNMNTKDMKHWGKYDIILQKPNYKIKEIEILPQKSISLQLHHHRCEHWIITYGTAEVILGDQKFTKKANDFLFIPKNTKHKIKNISDSKNLVLIEIQYGDILSEDDIIRFDENKT